MMSEIVQCCYLGCNKPAIAESKILELCSEHFEEWKVNFEANRK